PHVRPAPRSGLERRGRAARHTALGRGGHRGRHGRDARRAAAAARGVRTRRAAPLRGDDRFPPDDGGRGRPRAGLIRWSAEEEGLAFHDLAAGRVRLDPAPEIEIAPPAYRGKRLLPVVSWLVTNRLAAP